MFCVIMESIEGPNVFLCNCSPDRTALDSHLPDVLFECGVEVLLALLV